MKMYANLHVHSTHSDGVYSPTELVQIAKQEGYRALAIADHDTATAYPELKSACDQAGLECIFGVEFSAPSKLLEGKSGQSGEFHITAYHFDPEYPAMKQYLYEMSCRETDQTKFIFDRGVRRGTITNQITWEDVLEHNPGITWLCNDHVFSAMRKMGIATWTDYPSFYADNWGDKYDVPPSRPFKQVDEIIQLVRDAGGIALVAHPNNQLQHLDALLEMGLEGLEVWHPSLQRSGQWENALRLALDKGLYISGGSDHSGLLGGQYQFYEKPEETRYYIPECSAGTTYEYFLEIKNRKITR